MKVYVVELCYYDREVAESKCDKCGEEYRQLAKWLEELLIFRIKHGGSI